MSREIIERCANRARSAMSEYVREMRVSGKEPTFTGATCFVREAILSIPTAALDRLSGGGEADIEKAWTQQSQQHNDFHGCDPRMIFDAGWDAALSQPIARANVVDCLKSRLRDGDDERDGYTDAGMEDAFFRWPVIERELHAFLNTTEGQETP